KPDTLRVCGRESADSIASIYQIERGARNRQLFPEYLRCAFDDRTGLPAGLLVIIVLLSAIRAYGVVRRRARKIQIERRKVGHGCAPQRLTGRVSGRE